MFPKAYLSPSQYISYSRVVLHSTVPVALAQSPKKSAEPNRLGLFQARAGLLLLLCLMGV